VATSASGLAFDPRAMRGRLACAARAGPLCSDWRESRVNSVSALETLRRQATRTTHRIHSLPMLVLMPHSRCNCRCVMCDIWQANSEKRELSHEDLERQMPALRKLHVQRVVLSGGEALMHQNLWLL